MYKCSTASPTRACGCDQMSKKVSNAKHVSLRAQNRQGPAHSQEPRQRPFSTVCSSSVAPCSHQRRWSADFGQCGTSPVIVVRKNKKEPLPPQRSISLVKPNTASHPSFKRYSCPPIGVLSTPSRPSSSSSSTSSCSSPPPVKTSVITGHDPLGWKLQPKSGPTSPRVRTNRLSLQIPLPVIFLDPKSGPAPRSQSDNTPNPHPSTKPKVPLKPSRRRHSDSSAFLISLPQPAVTLEELCTVHLRRVSLTDDDVFSRGTEEEVKGTARPRKTPPPTPEKTAMARQVAQLIAHSRRHCKTNEENIYSSVIKPKPRHPHTEKNSSLHMRKTAGLRVESSCDRERSTPRFPG